MTHLGRLRSSFALLLALLSPIAFAAPSLSSGIDTIDWTGTDDAIAINIYRMESLEKRYVTTLPGTSTAWMPDSEGVYVIQVVNASPDWRDWALSNTVLFRFGGTAGDSLDLRRDGTELRWNAITGAERYNVYRWENGVAIYVLTVEGLAYTPLFAGSYHVEAITSSDWRDWLRSETVVVDVVASFPAFTVVADGAILSWDPLPDVDTYNIHRLDDDGYGQYITSLSGNQWGADSSGSYFVTAVTSPYWQDWVSSEPVEVVIDSDPASQWAALIPGADTLFGEPIADIPLPDWIQSEIVGWDHVVDGDNLSHPEKTIPLMHQQAWDVVRDFIPAGVRSNLIQLELHAGRSLSNQLTRYARVVAYTSSEIPVRRSADLQLSEAEIEFLAGLTAYQSVSLRDLDELLFAAGFLLMSADFYPISAVDDYSAIYIYPLPIVLKESRIGRYITANWLDIHNDGNVGRDDLWSLYPDYFVSYRASGSVWLDFSETFKVFVTGDSMPDHDGTVATDKIRWFWSDPELVLVRDHMRAYVDE